MVKPFFWVPIRGSQITKDKEIIEASRNLVDRILELEQNQALVIQRKIVPTNYKEVRKFLRHAPEVKPKRYTREQLSQLKKTPVQLRQEVFAQINHPYYCAYSIVPLLGNEQVKRKISLVSCLEGAKIYAKSYQEKHEKIKLGKYDKSKKVALEGAIVPVLELPSRTEGKPPFKFNLVSVPVIDNERKYTVSYSFCSDGHMCEDKQFRFRYKPVSTRDRSHVFNICPHEVAAYLKTIDMYLNMDYNLIPLQMSQLVLPSESMIDYYKKINKQVAITYIDRKDKLKIRPLNLAEKEIFLWALVKKKGPKSTTFARTNLRDYNWE